MVGEALAAGAAITDVFVRAGDESVRYLAATAADRGATVLEVDDRVLKAIAETVTPQGVVARVEVPTVELDDLLREATLVLVLDQVRDPGNAGTLIRSAAAAGADAVVFTAGSVDPYAPKTVRATAGAIFRVGIVHGESMTDAAVWLRSHGIGIIAAGARAPRSCYELDMTTPIALVIGNEAWGLDAAVSGLSDGSVAVPMSADAESLNAAVAGSILLFEARRQRAAKATGPANPSRLS